MSCGETVVGTVWNGDDGENGVSCVSKDNEDGTVTVTCGDANPVTIYKAMCGADSYDPAKKFCVLGKLYDKCGDKAYTINRQYCDNGVVTDLCSEYFEKRTGVFEFVKDRAVAEGEFCWNGIITKLCDGKEYGENEFCGPTKDGKGVTVYSYSKCPNEDLTAREMKEAVAEAYSALGISASSEAEDVEAEESLFGNLIGDPIVHFEPYQMQSFTTLWKMANDLCLTGYADIKDECGSTEYNPTEKICDARDNKLYKYTKYAISFETQVQTGTRTTGNWPNQQTVPVYGTKTYKLYWMTENLAFEYKLPKVIVEMNGDEIVKKSIDALDGVVKYEDDVYESFPAEEGRYYTWNAATGADDFRGSLEATEIAKLDEVHRTVGACPAGWRLPTKAELESLSALAAKPETENGFEDLEFNVQFLGSYGSDDGKAYFWSGTADDSDMAYGLTVTDKITSAVKISNKTYAFTIRCVSEYDVVDPRNN
jgi:uncharacterized protein (TIGR02145 family)